MAAVVEEREVEARPIGAIPPPRGGLALGLGIGVIALLAALAAWLSLRDGGDSAEQRVLVTDATGAVSLLDPATESYVFTVPNAVVVPDRSAVLSTSEFGDGTLIETVDAATGQTVGSQTVPERLEMRTVSPAGGAVALMEPRSASLGLYVPEPRESTTIVVARLEDAPEHQRFELDGNFEPETFSTDEQTLFLLEFWPPTDPNRYFVRQLDLTSGEVADVFSPEVNLQPEMKGTAGTQVISPDGAFLFTLYTAVNSDGWYAFVHAISLDEEWSFCIFLPTPFGSGDVDKIGMGISPDGDTLYVVDSSTRRLGRSQPSMHASWSLNQRRMSTICESALTARRLRLHRTGRSGSGMGRRSWAWTPSASSSSMLSGGTNRSPTSTSRPMAFSCAWRRHAISPLSTCTPVDTSQPSQLPAAATSHS